MITTDASPWGLGGWISVNGNILSWYSEKITANDVNALQRQIGEHESQQAFEGLALLVVVRAWRPLWCRHRIQFGVRTDNVGALTLAAALKRASSLSSSGRPNSSRIRSITSPGWRTYCPTRSPG